jgi:hypothetical protein
MKTLRLVVILSLFPSLAWAIPSPKDVADQMASGNTAKAEALTREILKERPNSPKAHYYLGQILTKEGKYQEAYGELGRAAEMDKSLSFASSDVRFRNEMRKVEINLGKVEAPKANNERHLGRAVAVTLAIFLAAGGLIWAAFAICGRKEKAAKEKARQQDLSEQTSRLVALLEKASSLEVAAKLSDSAEKERKLSALAGIKDELNDLLARNKKGKEMVNDASITRIERSLRQVETGSAGLGFLDRTPSARPELSSFAAAKPKPEAERHQGSSGPQPRQTSPSAPSVTNNYVASGGSDSGFVEGMLLGELMSSHDQRSVVERETIIERPTEKIDESDEDSFDDSRRDSFDSGGDSGFDSGSDSSFDSGDSFDSGGDSSW